MPKKSNKSPHLPVGDCTPPPPPCGGLREGFLQRPFILAAEPRSSQTRPRGILGRRGDKFIIGIDEAGRGPLAGPVVVAGVLVKKNVAKRLKILKGIKDSKKLTARKRELIFSILTKHPKIQWSVVKVWPKVIDRVNIAQATNIGVSRVYRRLLCSRLSLQQACLEHFLCSRLSLQQACLEHFALLDGSLFLSSRIPHKTIIKGDEKIPVISAASIIAKVIRDRLMLRLHKKFPQYRFDLHKGYGTKLHRNLIKVYGTSSLHRLSFRHEK